MTTPGTTNPFRTPHSTPESTSQGPPPAVSSELRRQPQRSETLLSEFIPDEAPPAYTPVADLGHGEATVEAGPTRPFQQAPAPSIIMGSQLATTGPVGVHQTGVSWQHANSAPLSSNRPPPPRHPSIGSAQLTSVLPSSHQAFSPPTGPQPWSTPSTFSHPNHTPLSLPTFSPPSVPPPSSAPPSSQPTFSPPLGLPPSSQSSLPPPPRHPSTVTSSPSPNNTSPSSSPSSSSHQSTYQPPPLPPRQYMPPPGSPPRRPSPAPNPTVLPDDGRPTTTPTPGRPLLRDGRTLVYPMGYVCPKCNNTGYKNFDPSHPCRKCWDHYSKAYAGAVVYAPQSGGNFQRPLPNFRPPQTQLNVGYPGAGYRTNPPPPAPAPPPPQPAPPPTTTYAPSAYPPSGALVVQPGDPRIGGRLCWRCSGRGTVSFMIFDQETCEVCNGMGRVFN